MWKQNTIEIYKLPNINYEKDKESILKKYLRWINGSF